MSVLKENEYTTGRYIMVTDKNGNMWEQWERARLMKVGHEFITVLLPEDPDLSVEAIHQEPLVFGKDQN